jgi:hypothetical protein
LPEATCIVSRSESPEGNGAILGQPLRSPCSLAAGQRPPAGGLSTAPLCPMGLILDEESL